jgi:hypothetical protein
MQTAEQTGREPLSPAITPFYGISMSRESGLLAALCLFDLWLTVVLIQRGIATEGNPVLQVYLDAGLPAFIAGKLLLSLVPVICLCLLRRQHPRFIQQAERAGILLYLLCYVIEGLQMNSAHWDFWLSHLIR